MSRANRSRAARNCLGQELERALGAAAPRTDFRVATCQLDRSGPFFRRDTRPLSLVDGVGSRALGHTRVERGRLCQRISWLKVKPYSGLSGCAQYFTEGRAEDWSKMLVLIAL